jgi:hypothetical protein
VENASVKKIVSGDMFPPVWFPTSSTGPVSGTFFRFRTSARYQMVAMSHESGRFSRM